MKSKINFVRIIVVLVAFGLMYSLVGLIQEGDVGCEDEVWVFETDWGYRSWDSWESRLESLVTLCEKEAAASEKVQKEVELICKGDKEWMVQDFASSMIWKHRNSGSFFIEDVNGMMNCIYMNSVDANAVE